VREAGYAMIYCISFSALWLVNRQPPGAIGVLGFLYGSSAAGG
jgi:hypothetical protein